MLVICAGMFRSGSTWQYQVACELARLAGWPTKRLGFLESTRLEAFLAEPRDPAICHLYKTHPPDPIHASLDPAELRVLYCYRDMRDVAYSLAHKYGIDFRSVIEQGKIEQCLAADAFWSVLPQAVVQRYEDWLGDNLPFVRRIAAGLGIDLPPAALAAVAEQYSFDRNRARTQEIAARLQSEGVDLADPANALRHDSATLLHWNHLRTGMVGQWRAVATPEERALLAAACGDWLVARGYERDHSWANGLRQAA